MRLRGNISQFKKHEILSRDLNFYAKIEIVNGYSPQLYKHNWNIVQFLQNFFLKLFIYR